MIEIIPNWHPVFVHFAVALVLVSLALYVASFAMGEGSTRQQVQAIARWNLWFGSVASVLTVLAGIYAFNTVAHDTPSHAAMTEHRNWALATLVVVLQVAIWAWMRQRRKLVANWPFLGAFLLGGFLMVSTAWHGGELVYRHGLGVMSLPKTGHHAHAPGEEHSHGETGQDQLDADHHHEDLVSDDHHHNEPLDGMDAEAVAHENDGHHHEH